MAWWDDTLDLGADRYRKDEENGIDEFLTKPSQRPYQPFTPQQPAQQQYPQPAQQEPAQQQPAQQQYPQQYPQQYQSPLDELDAYDSMQSQQTMMGKDATEFKKSADIWENRYKKFKKEKLEPFYGGLNLFGDVETDDDYITHIDEEFDRLTKLSSEEDGFFSFGPSDEKISAKERLKAFGGWNAPHGLRDQFRKLKEESEGRRSRADEADIVSSNMMEAMLNIPRTQREAMDSQIKARKKSTSKTPPSKKKTDDLLDSLHWEKPKYWKGGLLNPDRIDPRTALKSTGKEWWNEYNANASNQKQNERMVSAMKGDLDGVLNRRQQVIKDRRLRSRGAMFSYGNGTVDGHYPTGLAKSDTDLLDLDRMRKAGMTEYNGQPLENMVAQLGGPERLGMAKILSSVYEAKNNWQDSQIQFLKSIGSSQSDKLKKDMQAAEELMHKSVSIAAQHGLDNELFEQAESVGWLESLGNAITRGGLMSEQSNYTKEFITNTLDLDDMQRLIEIQSEIEDLPGSTALERYQKMDKGDTLIKAMGKLVLDEPLAAVEMFVESMSALLPTAVKVGVPTAVGGVIIGALTKGKGGAEIGGRIGAALGMGLSSFSLEAAGNVMESMQELNINIKDPKVFAAAWHNDVVRNKIVDKAVKKGVPIGFMDAAAGGMAGRVSASLVHANKAMFKGGKLIDAKTWAKSVADVPRFTRWQRARSVGAELGFDAFGGMGGEYLGQAWSKEPGEAWDWDAIAAEGVIGIGPGAIGGAIDYYNTSKGRVEFENATFNYSNVRTGPEGKSGTMNRAGWIEDFRTFSSADGMTDALLKAGNLNVSTDPNAPADKAMWVQDWIARMWSANPEKMSNLRVVMNSQRTSVRGGDKLGGAFEHDEEGNPVLYISKVGMKDNPIAHFMHESGHFAREMIFENPQEMYDMYDTLSKQDRLEAYSAYHNKKPGVSFHDLSPAEQNKTQKAFDNMGQEKLAEEWFAYQWGALLAGQTVDNTVSAPLKQFLDGHIKPYLEKWIGDPNLGSKENSVRLQQKVLGWMGYDSYGVPKMGGAGTEVDFDAPNMRSPAGVHVMDGLNEQEGLNALVDKLRLTYRTEDGLWGEGPEGGDMSVEEIVDAMEEYIGEDMSSVRAAILDEREAQNLDEAASGIDPEAPPPAEPLDPDRPTIKSPYDSDADPEDATAAAPSPAEPTTRDKDAARRRKLGEYFPQTFVDSAPEGKFTVTESLPGFRSGERGAIGDPSGGGKVTTYDSREEAEAAAKKIRKRQHDDITASHKKLTDAKEVLEDDVKFQAAYDKAAEKLADEYGGAEKVPDTAIAAEIIGLEGMREESYWGDHHMGQKLAEEGLGKTLDHQVLDQLVFESEAKREGARDAIQGEIDELKQHMEKNKGLDLTGEERAEGVKQKAEWTSRLDALEKYKDLLIPEEYGVDWKDTPHPLLEWQLVDKDGKALSKAKVYAETGERGGEVTGKLTFGEMAQQSGRVGRTEVSKGVYREIGSWNKTGKWERKDQHNLQQKLQELARDPSDGGYDPSKQATGPDAPISKKKEGLTPNQYRKLLDAVRAAELSPSQFDVGTSPKGKIKIDPKGKELPGDVSAGFSAGKGTPLATLALDKVQRLSDQRAKDEFHAARGGKPGKPKAPVQKLVMRYKPHSSPEAKDGYGMARDGMTGENTMDWIEAGQRTATTRLKQKGDSKFKGIEGLKVGDVVEVVDGDRKLLVEVTKEPYPPETLSDEEWSQLEGWAPEEHAKHAKGSHLQFQYKLYDPSAEAAASRRPDEKVNRRPRTSENTNLSNPTTYALSQYGGTPYEKSGGLVQSRKEYLQDMLTQRRLDYVQGKIDEHLKTGGRTAEESLKTLNDLKGRLDSIRARGSEVDGFGDYASGVEEGPEFPGRTAAKTAPPVLDDQGNVLDPGSPMTIRWDEAVSEFAEGKPREDAIKALLDIIETDITNDANNRRMQVGGQFNEDEATEGTLSDEEIVEQEEAARGDEPRPKNASSLFSSFEHTSKGTFADGEKTITVKSLQVPPDFTPDQHAELTKELAAEEEALKDAQEARAEAMKAGRGDEARDALTAAGEHSAKVSELKKQLNRDVYDFKQAGVDPGHLVKSRAGVHTGFTRGSVDEGVNIMELILALPGVKQNPELAEKIHNYDFGKVESSKVATEIYDENGELKPDLIPNNGETVTVDVSKQTVEFTQQKGVMDPESGGQTSLLQDVQEEGTVDVPTEDGGTTTETVGLREDKTFRWHNGSWRIGKSFTKVANKDHLAKIKAAWEQELDKRFTGASRSANMVTAADLVDFFINMKGSVNKFGDIPSSDVKNKVQTQYPGAPGAGLLLPVWDEFIDAIYDKLNINKKRVASGGKGSKVKSQLANAVQVIVDGKLTGNVLKGKERLVSSMHADLAPIFQAVMDADRANLYERATYEKTDVDTDGTVVKYDPREKPTSDADALNAKTGVEAEGKDESPIDPTGTAGEDFAFGPNQQIPKDYMDSKFRKAVVKGAKDQAKADGLTRKATTEYVSKLEGQAIEAFNRVKGSKVGIRLLAHGASLTAGGGNTYSHRDLLQMFPQNEGINGGPSTSIEGDNPNIWQLFDLDTVAPIILEPLDREHKPTGTLERNKKGIQDRIATQEKVITAGGRGSDLAQRAVKEINKLKAKEREIDQKLAQQDYVLKAQERRAQDAPGAPPLASEKAHATQMAAVEAWLDKIKKLPLHKAFFEMVYNPGQVLSSGVSDKNKPTYREMLMNFLFGKLRKAKLSTTEPEPKPEAKPLPSRRNFLKSLGLGATVAHTGLPTLAKAAAAKGTTGLGAALTRGLQMHLMAESIRLQRDIDKKQWAIEDVITKQEEEIFEDTPITRLEDTDGTPADDGSEDHLYDAYNEIDRMRALSDAGLTTGTSHAKNHVMGRLTTFDPSNATRRPEQMERILKILSAEVDQKALEITFAQASEKQRKMEQLLNIHAAKNNKLVRAWKYSTHRDFSWIEDLNEAELKELEAGTYVRKDSSYESKVDRDLDNFDPENTFGTGGDIVGMSHQPDKPLERRTQSMPHKRYMDFEEMTERDFMNIIEGSKKQNEELNDYKGLMGSIVSDYVFQKLHDKYYSAEYRERTGRAKRLGQPFMERTRDLISGEKAMYSPTGELLTKTPYEKLHDEFANYVITANDVKEAYLDYNQNLTEYTSIRHANMKAQIKELKKAVHHAKSLGPDFGVPQLSLQKAIATVQGALEGLKALEKNVDKALNIGEIIADRVDRVTKEMDKTPALENQEVMGEEINIMPEKEKVPVKRKGSKGDSPGPLSSGMVLTSGVPDTAGNLSMLGKLFTNNQDDPERDNFVSRFLKRNMLMSDYVDQARPLKNLHDRLLSQLGIPEDHPLFDALKTHRKWHAYYGKGFDVVDRAGREYIDPIKEALRDHGITLEQFGEYLLARAAPSRNNHLRIREEENQKEELAKLYVKDRPEQSDRYKALVEEHKKREIPTSGIEDHVALEIVHNMETDAVFMGFLKDARQPLQKFYAMNRDALKQKTRGGLIQDTAGLNEEARMVAAMSHFDWNINDPESGKERSKIKLADKYSYAPMQGFIDETDRIRDREEAYERLGKSGTTAGKGFDQPKQKFLSKGAFGRGTFEKDGVKGSWAPNPEITFATAIEQYFNDAIRSQKNTVSQSFGDVFNIMRAASDSKYLKALEATNPEWAAVLNALPKQALEDIKKDFHETFEMEFKSDEKLKEYQLSDDDITDENGNVISRLKTRSKKLSTEFKDDPLVFVYREKGIAKFIKLKATNKGAEMASTMKNLKYQAIANPIVRKLNWGTRTLAKLYTSINPAFIIPNFFRDYGTAFIHLTEDEKRGLAKDALSMPNIAKFGKAIFFAERMRKEGKDPLGGLRPDLANKKAMNKMASDILLEGDRMKMYEFAQSAGAKVGYFRHESIIQQIEGINKELSRPIKGVNRGLKLGSKIGGVVDNMNTAVENSIRMSAFWAAIKRGDSVEKATHIARNVTVDFNQKGNFTQGIGSAYVFFGAGMNSIDRMTRSLLKRSPEDRAVLFGSMIGASIVVNLFNRMMDSEDGEEEQADYDTINHYKRDTNLIVPMPSWFYGNTEKYAQKDTGYFSLPLPLGYNALWAVGQVVGDLIARQTFGANAGTSVGNAIGRLTESFGNAVNPLNSDSLLTMIVPSVGKPLTQLAMNEDFMGRPIKYEQSRWEEPKPAHMNDPRKVHDHWTWVSKQINSFFGGSDTTKGTLLGDPNMSSEEASVRFDISGGQFMHLVHNYLGGWGKMADASISALTRPMDLMGKNKKMKFDWGAIPIVNRFARSSTYGVNIRRDFRSLHHWSKTIEGEIKRASAIGPKSEAAVRSKYRKVMPMVQFVKNVEKNSNALSRKMKKVENNFRLSDMEMTQQVDTLTEQELKSQIQAIRKARALGVDL